MTKRIPLSTTYNLNIRRFSDSSSQVAIPCRTKLMIVTWDILHEIVWLQIGANLRDTISRSNY